MRLLRGASADGVMGIAEYCRRLIGRPRQALGRIRRAVAPRAHERPPEDTAALAGELALALRRGRSPQMAGLSVYQHLAVLRHLIETGDIALCKAYAASPDVPLGRFKSFDWLVMLVRTAPQSEAGDAGDLPPRSPDDGLLTLGAPGRHRALLVFTGMAQQFGCPLPIVHQWFRGMGASLIYLFDTEGTYYLGGIAKLARSREEAADRLREISGRMGATSIHCVGNSGGGFGALAYAPVLDARRTLALSPPTTIRESLDTVCSRAPHLRRLVTEEGTISLASLHRGVTAWPCSRVYYPAENSHDHEEARAIADLPGIEVRPLAGVKDHNLVPYLISQDRFAGELGWLMSG